MGGSVKSLIGSLFFLIFFSDGAKACDEIDAVLCIEGNGDVVFQPGFIKSVEEMGLDASGARSSSGGPVKKSIISQRQMHQLNSQAGEVGSASRSGGDGQIGQAAGGGVGSGGGFGYGGNANTGFESSVSEGSRQETFQGFNNFDGSDVAGKRSGELNISPGLASAISQQGKRAISSVGSSSNGSGSGESARRQALRAANTDGANGGYKSSGGGQAIAYDDSPVGEQGGGVAAIAKNFVKGVFGVGSRRGKKRRGKSHGDRSKSKASLAQVHRKTKTPEQILREKWNRMRMSGQRVQRGLAHSVPRGMLDRHIFIFHGLCKEYSNVASNMGEADSGYCPPSQ